MIFEFLQVVAYDESVSGFDRFYKYNKALCLGFYALVMVLRLMLNVYIHIKSDSPAVRESISDIDQLKGVLNESKAHSDSHAEQRRRDRYVGTPGMSDFEGIEFLLIALFSLWFSVNSDDTPAMVRLKKWANGLSVFALALTALVITMFYRLQ